MARASRRRIANLWNKQYDRVQITTLSIYRETGHEIFSHFPFPARQGGTTVVAKDTRLAIARCEQDQRRDAVAYKVALPEAEQAMGHWN